jgi:2-C-methyl-D-erythritol 4-phosphate cytidylyltransferase/2-C-methyl-D-erythritol 2,4-cyclodiphosphate synthase
VTIAALIVAAGSGERFGGSLPKQYLPLGGKPVLWWSVRCFLTHPRIDRVVVVIAPDHQAWWDAQIAPLLTTPVSVVQGGATRQDSVRLGLEWLATHTPPPAQVLIHDAARPLVPDAVIHRVCDALATDQAVIPALPLCDTLKQAEGAAILRTLPRERMVSAQTPQGFDFQAILSLHRAAGTAHTDDAALAEASSLPVVWVMGDARALKLTHPQELPLLESLMPSVPCVGNGFDTHRFAAPSADAVVTICGVRIPHSHGIEAHSDGDVGLHALTDALLGAVGAGDIGQLFPPSDPQWRGADSAQFVEEALRHVRAAGGRLQHIDITLLAEAPRITPYRDAMRMRLAEICGLPLSRVGLKATTTERMGFIGRGKGIAALATATVCVVEHGDAR